jgi:hypothetical protein
MVRWSVVAVFNAVNNATTTMVEGFGLEQWCLVLKFGEKNPIIICLIFNFRKSFPRGEMSQIFYQM